MCDRKTITFQGNEYFVTHEFEGNQVWAYRELGSGLSEVYRRILGSERTEIVVASIMQHVLAVREYMLEAETIEAQEALNYELDQVV